MYDKIKEAIQDAEMVLVGIGEEFSPSVMRFEGAEELEPYYRSRFYETLPENHEVIQAYNELRDLIGAKPYFVVTLNTDDLIYRSRLEQDLIAAPCGSMNKMQCAEHIVDGREIREQILEAAGFPSSGSGEGTGEIPSDIISRLAVCPECGSPLAFHTIENEAYIEQGYLPQWEKYTKWLQYTLHRKLCILELGVGFRFPQVIRWPFEKTAFFNQKAKLVRVHSRFPQLAEELVERGISIAQSPVEVLCR